MEFKSSLYDFDGNLLNMINDKVHLEKDGKIIRVFSKDMHKYFKEGYTFEGNDLTKGMQEFKDDLRFFHSTYEALQNQEQFGYSLKSFFQNTIKANHIGIMTGRSISVEALKLFHKNIILHYLSEDEKEIFMNNMRKKVEKLLYYGNYDYLKNILGQYKDHNLYQKNRQLQEWYSSILDFYDLVEIYINGNFYIPINNIKVLSNLGLTKESMSNDEKKKMFFKMYLKNCIQQESLSLGKLFDQKYELEIGFSDDDHKNIEIIKDLCLNIKDDLSQIIKEIKENDERCTIENVEFESNIFYVNSDENSLFEKFEIENEFEIK